MLAYRTVTTAHAAARYEIIRYATIIRTALGASFTTTGSLQAAQRAARELQRAADELADMLRDELARDGIEHPDPRAPALQDRVDYAAQVIRGDYARSRKFDDCFEWNDGDQVAAELRRRALTDRTLAANLNKYLGEPRA